MSSTREVPQFDSLPSVDGMPEGCAWGIFDNDGKRDVYGCLNHLTTTVIQEAYKEARDGISISLNAPLDAIKVAVGRKALIHKVINWRDLGVKFDSWDDEVEFNTQGSSQWDSLLHYGHQASGRCYNGTQPTKQILEQPSELYDKEKEIPSLDHWHDRGGLVGRGVLLDYREYANAKGISYDCLTDHVITTKDLEAIAEFQGTLLRSGDILIIRTGLLEHIMSMSAEEQAKNLTKEAMIGVEGTRSSAEWFWNQQFSAVACDTSAFEVLPPRKEDGTIGSAITGDLVLHEYFLGLFGLNIGELWSLEALGKHCKESKRYSFLLTSIPINVPGLVGSPPNALAIF